MNITLSLLYNIFLAIVTLIATAWLVGMGHWIAMYIYNNIECHRFSLIGFLWSPLEQARVECVFLWRIANHLHWSLFDIFGKIISTIIPSA